jgi:hypothetical protein
MVNIHEREKEAIKKCFILSKQDPINLIVMVIVEGANKILKIKKDAFHSD